MEKDLILYKCPTCGTGFNQETLPKLFGRLQEFLINRPSASMDCNLDKVNQCLSILNSIQSILISSVRKPTNMMDSQNAIGDQLNAVSQRTEG